MLIEKLLDQPMEPETDTRKTGTDHVFFNSMCPVKRSFAVPAKRGLSLFLEVLI
jgi:hypothetical protein